MVTSSLSVHGWWRAERWSLGPATVELVYELAILRLRIFLSPTAMSIKVDLYAIMDA